MPLFEEGAAPFACRLPRLVAAKAVVAAVRNRRRFIGFSVSIVYIWAVGFSDVEVRILTNWPPKANAIFENVDEI